MFPKKDYLLQKNYVGHVEGKLLSEGDFEMSCGKGAMNIQDTETLAFSSSATK